jgi:hypothetical protein
MSMFRSFAALVVVASGPSEARAEHGTPVSAQYEHLAQDEGPLVMRQVITLDLRNVPLDSALRSIARLARLELTYSADVVPPGRRVTIRDSAITVAQAFAQVLKGLRAEARLAGPRQIAIVRLAERVASDTVTDFITGKVTGPDSLPLKGVLVTVASRVTRERRSGRTNDNGQFRVAFPGGGGDYDVHVVAIGFIRATAHVTRSGDQHVIQTGEIRMGWTTAKLAAMTIAAKQNPRRSPNDFTPVDELEPDQRFGAVTARLNALTDIRGLALNYPGVVPVLPTRNGGTLGFSVLGALPTQNSIQLDGSTMRGGTLPSGIIGGGANLTRATSDVTEGQFSGAQLSGNTNWNFGRGLRTRITLTVTDPAIQWGNSSLASTQERSLSQVAIFLSKAFGKLSPTVNEGRFPPHEFEMGLDFIRQRQPSQSLLSAEGPIFRELGIAPDSVDRLRTIATSLGVPLSGSNSIAPGLSDYVTAFVGLNSGPWYRQNGIRINGYWSRAGSTALATAFPSFGGKTHTAGFRIQGRGMTEVNEVFPLKTIVSFESGVRSETPFIAIPTASVRVVSDLGTDDGSTSTLLLGGNGAYAGRTRFMTWEEQHTLSWMTVNKLHRRLLYGLVRVDWDREEPSTDPYGTYTFNSLGDLATSNAATFSRILREPAQDGHTLNSALAFQDMWRITRRTQFVTGLRLEGSHALNGEASNPAIASYFGERTDVRPTEVHLSPRFSLSWLHGKRASGGPVGTLRAVVAEHRDNLRSDLLQTVYRLNGLAGGTERLLCVGSAVPAPNWSNYIDPANIPSSCAGSGGVLLSDDRRRVAFFDSHYSTSRSWRESLSWSGAVFGERTLSIVGTISQGVDQPDVLDLNLIRTPAFTLPAEGDRPVFAPVDAIVAGTGAISPTESRVNDEFGQVMRYSSGLRRRARELRVDFVPLVSSDDSPHEMTIRYTYGRSRDEQRGVFGITGGNPFVAEWGTGDYEQRHRFDVGYTLSLRGQQTSFSATFDVALLSGRRFTPLVAGDVNGDGQLLNDRAFVFNPTTSTDAALAAGMETLLSTGPDRVRSCLAKQVGRMAERNSCVGPRQAILNAGMDIRSPRGSLRITLVNPLALFDRALHGSDMRGWGGLTPPDPTLLSVSGFDAATKQFKYTVNPGFGRARLDSRAQPFAIYFSITPNFEGNYELAETRKALGWEKGPEVMPTPEAFLANVRANPEILFGLDVNPYKTVLAAQDTLLLTVEQTEAITRLATQLDVTRDSTFRGWAKEVTSFDSKKSISGLFPVMRKWKTAILEQYKESGRQLRKILAPEQWELDFPDQRLKLVVEGKWGIGF